MLASRPLHSVGNRTDFTFLEWGLQQTKIGRIEEVLEGPCINGYQCEHVYIIVDSGGKRYRIGESQVSTPYGPHDD